MCLRQTWHACVGRQGERSDTASAVQQLSDYLQGAVGISWVLLIGSNLWL